MPYKSNGSAKTQANCSASPFFPCYYSVCVINTPPSPICPEMFVIIAWRINSPPTLITITARPIKCFTNCYFNIGIKQHPLYIKLLTFQSAQNMFFYHHLTTYRNSRATSWGTKILFPNKTLTSNILGTAHSRCPSSLLFVTWGMEREEKITPA